MGTEKRERQKAGTHARRAEREEEMRRAQRRRSILTFAGIAGAVLLVAVFLSLRGGGDDASPTPDLPDATDEPGTGDETAEPGEVAAPLPCPPADGVDTPVISFPAPPPDCLTPGVTYTAVFDTSAGEIVVELDTDETPGVTNNFVYLARYGFYDGTEMFRTDPSIDIIQGGAPTTNSPSDPGPGYTIPDEGGPFVYVPGDLVMARTPAPDSSGAQYFFSAGPDTALLNDQGTYLRFGRTTEGLDVLEAILASHLDDPDNPLGGSPDPTVTVRSVTIVES